MPDGTRIGNARMVYRYCAKGAIETALILMTADIRPAILRPYPVK